MIYAGYEWVRAQLKLAAVAPARPAAVRPVSRVEPMGDHLAVPVHVVPAAPDPLSHLLFALKHEGVNMQILAQALPKITPQQMTAALRAAPNGQYVRVAAYLWELHTGQHLDTMPMIAAGYVDLFDSTRYVTGPDQRNARWRVNFNGIGAPDYCVTVERTPTVEAGMRSDVLGRTRAFAESLDSKMKDRALSWAYLHETEDSYAMEREVPSPDRTQRIVALLKQAHEPRALSEDYLVELQQSTVSGARTQAMQFRIEQNWLTRGDSRGSALDVTYVPPGPDTLPKLMTGWLTLANTVPRQIDPIVAASIISFGFVYLHPFMDGNGRLSRFLFHKALCLSGQLADGMLLPVSVAMNRHEADYLKTLQSFSSPVRELVQVTAVGDGRFYFNFQCGDTVWRYWDATPCVEFGFAMAEQALDVELLQETQYLARFDAVYRAINEAYDVRGSSLNTLIRVALQADGRISNTKRKRYADDAPPEVCDAIEAEARAVLHPQHDDASEANPNLPPPPIG